MMHRKHNYKNLEMNSIGKLNDFFFHKKLLKFFLL